MIPALTFVAAFAAVSISMCALLVLLGTAHRSEKIAQRDRESGEDGGESHNRNGGNL